VESFHQLLSKEVLLPFGVSLCFVGIILRGFARSSRRAAALRRQHWLHTRQPGEVDPTEKESGWFDKNLSVIANTAALGGLVVALLSFFRT
jgi:hypothetical protein